MRIGWDLDGVLFNFANSLIRYLVASGEVHKFNIVLDENGETHKWDFYEDWGMSLQQFIDYCNAAADAGYLFRGPIREGAREAMQASRNLGHTNVVITDRFFGSNGGRASHTSTTMWLHLYSLAFDELYFSANKLLVKTDLFIEDKLENYDTLVAGGVETYLLDRPWNKVEGGDSRKRIKSLEDYVNAITARTYQEQERANAVSLLSVV